MNIKYDSKIDAVYIEFSSGEYDRSRKISNAVLVDEDKKGKLLGVEILDAKKNMPLFKPENERFEIQSI